ncbi:hypothetical protein C2E23DRAFT_453402 [Lenzites betulinus]|nr:hypothetical protein C2E23DRAFT_453402 [Lenzites betulinus]
MPAERTTKTALRQSTLLGFTKSIPPTTTKPAKAKPFPDASDASDTPSVERVKPIPTPKAKQKSKGKSKAVDEDRVMTDVLLSIKPEFTKLISQQKKNHEYRKYKLKDSVVRLWLYETAPTSAITYVMETTTPRVPGEVNDPTGVGNDDFDKGLKQSKYGYPVTGLYKLKEPITTLELKSRFDIAVPQGWRYATKKLVEGTSLVEDMEKVF